MRVRNDGSVQSSATPTHQNAGRVDDHAMYRCMVSKVIYVDDPANITANSANPRVLYEVVVLGGFASGQIISNCRLASDLGGNDSMWERTLRSSTKEISGTRLSECDGDIVYVFFNQGHTGYATIIALDNGVGDAIAAANAQGPRSIRQYNGVYESINNSGELEIQVKGGVATPDKGKFIPASSPLVTFKVDKAQKYSRTFKSGLKVEEDGAADKITLTLAGGATVTIDGKADEITLKTSGGAELKLKTGKVALGQGAVEILDKLSHTADLVGQWATNVGAVHTHLGNLGYPTAPPDQAAGYTQLGTDLEQVKSDVDGIKGTL